MSRVIYIDSECKAHVTEAEGRTALEVDMFDGFADEFVEGFIVVPEGQTAKHPDGRILTGFTVAPWKPSSELEEAQRQYERELAEAARILLGEVSV